jgi:hypothetical protein
VRVAGEETRLMSTRKRIEPTTDPAGDAALLGAYVAIFAAVTDDALAPVPSVAQALLTAYRTRDRRALDMMLYHPDLRMPTSDYHALPEYEQMLLRAARNLAAALRLHEQGKEIRGALDYYREHTQQAYDALEAEG